MIDLQANILNKAGRVLSMALQNLQALTSLDVPNLNFSDE